MEPPKKVQIIGKVGAMSIDHKRFALPVVIKAQCPVCKQWVERDCEQHTFGYPTVNEVIESHLYCDGCGHEFPVKVKITLNIVAINE